MEGTFGRGVSDLLRFTERGGAGVNAFLIFSETGGFDDFPPLRMDGMRSRRERFGDGAAFTSSVTCWMNLV